MLNWHQLTQLYEPKLVTGTGPLEGKQQKVIQVEVEGFVEEKGVVENDVQQG